MTLWKIIYTIVKEHRIAAIIICYHPDEVVLLKNISAFADNVDKIIIWRNSDEKLSVVTASAWNQKIVWMGDGSNRFIAYPLNKAINWCVDNKYDYLLTMDQDSVWENFELIISQISGNKDIVIHSPNVNHCYQLPKDTISYVESVITSGSLLNIAIAKCLGGFREDYEIYWVDGEYCYWARKNGYKIAAYPEWHLTQEFGKQTRTIGGFYTSNYSPQIYYYIFRNMLWMHREHGNEAVSMKCILYTSMYNLRGIILGERNKLIKLVKIVSAFWHGLFSRIPSPRT